MNIDAVSKISSPLQFAALAMLLFYLFLRFLIKGKTSILGETLSFIIHIMLNTTFATILLITITAAYAYDYLRESLHLTGKSIIKVSNDANGSEKDYRRLGLNKTFDQPVFQSRRHLDMPGEVSYSISRDIEQGEAYTDNITGLVFEAAKIDIHKGATQLKIGPSHISADSLILQKDGGIHYQMNGMTYAIFLVNAREINDKKYVTLLIKQ